MRVQRKQECNDWSGPACLRPSRALRLLRRGLAADKDKAYFEVEMALQDDTHAAGCGCQPCQVKRACLRKAMTHPSEPSGVDRYRLLTVAVPESGVPAAVDSQGDTPQPD